jgi:uncharacterized protein YjbI with pentapeptide repeats
MAEITRKELVLALISAGDHPRLRGLDLSDLDMSGLDLNGANLTGANLSGANLSVADLSVADLSVTDLGGADLRGANLIGTNLHMGDLSGAELSWASLIGIYLIKANLSEANLYEADLRGANLSEANLSGANLYEADLSGADLHGANLSMADLRKADLSGTDLSDAYLLGAEVTNEQLAQASSLAGATTSHDADTVSTATPGPADTVGTNTSTSSPAVVRLEPDMAQVQIGATVSVQVIVENAMDLYGAEVHLTFDPALLEVVDADPGMPGVQIQAGDFLSADLVALNRVDQPAGKIDFATAQIPLREPVSGSGVLATIVFRGKATGAFPLVFASTILSTEDGKPIPATTQNGQVTVTGVKPLP